ncbi:T9SS type A sorting domain-containing protein [Flavobacterium sp. UMI-01]|uniref:T9SS type A sorting domain-containing protein n=1 Tax=Flavobacterium sp. UMI-01 TaxID=1441053 RepID=UPI001C7DAED0|nr:T9SS type A sorting domain-containing protein [Flavobacterium sp. UMI-01]
MVTASYTYNTANNGKIYIYGHDNGFNYYRIQVIGANVLNISLDTKELKAEATANIFSDGNLVSVANVKSNTIIFVYGVLGNLVKTVNTTTDTSFNLPNGMYVAKVKSAEGEKSVKLLIH